MHYMLANNKYFQNITVDNDVISNLPEDDDFTHIHTVTVLTSIAGVSDYFSGSPTIL